ncbi:MAG: FAD binding domain-containing protein [Thermoanaerobaculia bacterium]
MSLAELSQHPFERAETLEALCSRLAERTAKGEGSVLLNGGTDWIVERHLAPTSLAPATLPLVIDISRLAALRGISVTGDEVSIGAGATYLEIRRHELLTRRAPFLSAMCRDVGALQIQARGTLGGNVATASPAADGVAALAALDARIVLTSVRGERTVPIASYFTGYKKSEKAADEVILRFELTLPAEGAVTFWRKVGTRRAQAISKVALAAVAERDGSGRFTRLGFGMASVAPTTALLPTLMARAIASAKPLTDGELDALTLGDIAPIDDVRSTAEYRRHVACALVRQFFRTLPNG